MVFSEIFHMALCPPIFWSNSCNCQQVGLNQISFKIKMYYHHPLQHLAVLFLLFDQVVAMTSHLTMPGWHHQAMGLWQGECTMPPAFVLSVCGTASRWLIDKLGPGTAECPALIEHVITWLLFCCDYSHLNSPYAFSNFFPPSIYTRCCLPLHSIEGFCAGWQQRSINSHCWAILHQKQGNRSEVAEDLTDALATKLTISGSKGKQKAAPEVISKDDLILITLRCWCDQY